MSLEELQSQPELLEQEQFKQKSLALLAEELAHVHPPGYPAKPDRLHLSEVPRMPDGRPNLHGGPWETGIVLANMLDHIHIKASGLALDQWSRPVHPWLEDMLTNPDIGIVMGKGAFYHWGPNYTADAVVLQGDHVLLIQRKDGTLALPGGFVDATDADREAASRREVTEETGIIIPEGVSGQQFYRGPVADVRMTAHAWPETTAYLFEIPGNDPEVALGQDDALWAGWVPLEQARKERLYGSHSVLLETARQVVRA